MPTYRKHFREDLHLGHEVPLFDTDDINDKAITGRKIADRVIDWFHIIGKAIHNEHIDDDAVSTRTIQDKAVTTPKIQNKAVTPSKISDDFVEKVIVPLFVKAQKYHDEDMAKLYKQMDELRQLVTSYAANGIALSNQFGSHDDIGITQRTITNSINQIWNAIREMKGEVNDGISVTITPDWFISEDTAQVNILAQANDGVFEKLQIYINDVPVFEEPVENVQRYEYTAEMSETSKVVTKAQILGIEYTDEQYVTKYYPFFMGSGQDWEDIVNEKYARDLNHGKIRGGYNINIENEGDHMFIIVPSSREHEIVRFDMNGYEIPMVVLNNQKYTIYKSANTYRKGLFQIDITTNCECDDCEQ